MFDCGIRFTKKIQSQVFEVREPAKGAQNCTIGNREAFSGEVYTEFKKVV